MRLTRRATPALALILAAAGVLGGCQSPSKAPSPGMADPYPAPLNDPQVTVLSPALQPWLGFDAAFIDNTPGKPLQVQVPMRNLAARMYLVDYRFLFYDANGMELEPAMPWTMQALEPKQMVRLNGSAMTTKAASYRLEIKWSR